MKKLGSITYKELLIIVRDMPGLLILFIMPMFLIFVVTLAQDKSLQNFSDSKIEVLFVDNDNSFLSESIAKGLEESDFFEIIKEDDDIKLTKEKEHKLIASGKYQVGIIIPKGVTKSAEQKAKDIVEDSFNTDTLQNISKNDILNIADIVILLDPVIRDSYRNSVTSSLKSLIQAAEIKLLTKHFFELLPKELNKRMKQPLSEELDRLLKIMESEFLIRLQKEMGQYAPKNFEASLSEDINKDISIDFGKELEGLKFPWGSEKLVEINESFAQKETSTIKPTLIQNNVPAFSLFAMFFIVIPLAGSIITERNDGAYNRIRTLPVSYLSLLTGKVIVYSMVCFMQFVLMLITGLYILPVLFEMTPLDMGTNYPAIVIAALASSLAAIGFGLLIGTFANTHGQAAMFGSVMVVILGILGGIFVPVRLMPAVLQNVSIISPIRWGIDCFLDIFVREGNILTVLPDIIKMVLFFLVAQIIAIFRYEKRQ